MRPARLWAATVWVGLVAAPSEAAVQDPAALPLGYLAPAEIRLLADAVPSAPLEDSLQARADAEASNRARALENTDRWLLATRHAELRPGLALAHFDCALGFRLTGEGSPLLVGVLRRIVHDVDAAVEVAKARAYRPRPVGLDPDRAACQVLSSAARTSPSYPSGSAAVGDAYSEALAILVPDRAQELRRIGHEIGVSRIVCAMHFPSDVEAGRRLGAAVFEAIASKPAFVADISAARHDVDLARDRGLTSPACAAERVALAVPLP